MRILMIGLGSIGQRHLRNLFNYLGDQAQFLAYRVRGLQRTFSDNMQIREGISLEKEYSIQCFSDLDDAFSQKPDIVYVTNITSQHVPCALKAVKAGCDVFLEKPVSNVINGVHELIKTSQEKKKIVFIGFQNRYHPCLLRLRKMVQTQELGPIITVQAEVGERLTTMHTYEPYAETYMARKEQGGGVIMNQEIHELDYLQWIFGVPKRVAAFSGTNSNLEITVEDFCEAIYWVDSKFGKYPISVHADFFQYPPRRRCKVICEKGWIEADLLSATVTIGRGNQVRQTQSIPCLQGQPKGPANPGTACARPMKGHLHDGEKRRGTVPLPSSGRSGFPNHPPPVLRAEWPPGRKGQMQNLVYFPHIVVPVKAPPAPYYIVHLAQKRKQNFV